MTEAGLPSLSEQGAEGGGAFFKSLQAAAFSRREKGRGLCRSQHLRSLLGGGRARAGTASRSEGIELILPRSSRSLVCPLDCLVLGEADPYLLRNAVCSLSCGAAGARLLQGPTLSAISQCEEAVNQNS